MISPAQATRQKHEIELRDRRSERSSESTKMERLRIKLKQMQRAQMQIPRAS
jgi:hypothetical protein